MQSREQTQHRGQLEFDFGVSAKNASLRQPEPLVTIVEACQLFNVKPHVLRRAIKRGTIPSYRLGDSRIRLRASDIEAAIQSTSRGDDK